MNFDEIYGENADAVYRFLLKLTGDAHLAEEFTQECFYKAYKNVEKYDGRCRLSVWLCQIAKNCYFDYCKKAKNVPPGNGGDGFDGREIDDVLLQKETSLAIHKILHLLEEPYKEVFTLRVFGELSYRDISTLFGKSENWSRVIFYRAKAKILEKLP